MSFNMYRQSPWWGKTKSHRWVFLAGLIVGVILGWALNGVVSFVFRFGMVAFLLLPLIALGYFWWRSSRTRKQVQTHTMVQWTDELRPRQAFGSSRDETVIDDDIIDVTDVRPRETTR